MTASGPGQNDAFLAGQVKSQLYFPAEEKALFVPVSTSLWLAHLWFVQLTTCRTHPTSLVLILYKVDVQFYTVSTVWIVDVVYKQFLQCGLWMQWINSLYSVEADQSPV